MASPSYREGVNPLRPYYIPPNLAEQPGVAANIVNGTTTAVTATTSAAAVKSTTNVAASAGRYSSKARDMFPDIDYKDYINEPSPSVVNSARELLDDMMWKYTSVLMSQPFEVAKVLLQVRSYEEPEESQSVEPMFEAPKKPQRQLNSFSEGGFGFGDGDSDNDEAPYFANGFDDPNDPFSSHKQRQQLDPFAPHEEETPIPKAAPPPFPPHQLVLAKPNSVNEVIGQLWSKEGAWGVWKGSNSTFVYNVLQSLLENWSRSFLSAIFNVPDIGVKDDIDKLVGIASPYPWASLCVAAAAAVTTGLILCPLDLVRTRLLITPAGKGSRRTVSVLRSLPSHVCPPVLLMPTVLHSLVNPLLTLSTPLALRTQFRIDAEQSPMTYSFVKFCASAVSIFIKLPIETVLRRAQVSVISSPEYVHAADPSGNPIETIVPIGRYNGVFGTMYHIAAEEGVRAVEPVTPKTPTSAKSKRSNRTKVAETVYLKGQGMDGLWRGWKVNWWGLVGLWTANLVGSSGEGEF